MFTSRILKSGPVRLHSSRGGPSHSRAFVSFLSNAQSSGGRHDGEGGKSYYAYALQFALTTFALSAITYAKESNSTLIPTAACDEGPEDIKAILKALQKIEKSIVSSTGSGRGGSIDVVVGSQWGDEGKVFILQDP